MARDWKGDHARLEAMIQAGEGGRVKKLFRDLPFRRVPRSWLTRYAWLALRAHATDWALRALHGPVRLTGRATPASDDEVLYYALALCRSGLAHEAIELLEDIDDKKSPDALFTRSIALVSQWDYQPTIPLLRRYLDTPLTPYRRLVAEVNLAAALVHCRYFDEARLALDRLYAEAKENGHRLIEINLESLRAENFLLAREFAAARASLERAKPLSPEGSTEAFERRRWEAILTFLEDPNQVGNPLETVREDGWRMRRWETVRDCDLFWGVARNDYAALLDVYWGTPFAPFRARIENEFGITLLIQRTHLWRPAGDTKGRETRLSLVDGLINGRPPASDLGPVQRKLLAALCTDFYRPLHLSNLFSLVYSDEHFNPDTSPGRLHQAITRLRSWLRENEIPLEVSEEEEKYRLLTSGAIALELGGDGGGWETARLKKRWLENPFSSTEAAEELRLSDRSLRRLLDVEVKAGRLVREGKGPTCRYRFVSAPFELRRAG